MYSLTASMIGYQQVTNTGAEVTLGHTTTNNYSVGDIDLPLDYSYSPLSMFNNINRVTIGSAF